MAANKDDLTRKYPSEVLEWLVKVAQLPMLYYGYIPFPELYKVFESGKDQFPGHDGGAGVGDIGEDEFSAMLRSFLALANRPDVRGTPGAAAYGLTAKAEGINVVAIDMNPADFRHIRNERKTYPMEYKILTYDEVNQIIEKCYISTPASDALEDYLEKRWKKTKDEAVEIVRHLAIWIRTGEDLMTTVNELSRILGTNKEENAITMDEMNVLLQHMVNFYHGVGLINRYGWSPEELAQKKYGGMIHVDLDENGMPKGPLPEGVTLVPGSSEMAEMMKEHQAELEERGIKIDLNATASRYANTTTTPEGETQRGRAKKIYPNDPCPCGSGLKYKDCHGKSE